MSASGFRESDSTARQFYCRKEKSLGVLCTNFLKLYNKDGVDSIGLDAAATELGVERRRIYDIVNILESVGVVARKQKNQYSWKGFEAINRALLFLKEEGLRENFTASVACSSVKVNTENENEGSSSSKTDEQDNSATSKSENKREKSLLLLAQNFVKLFLCSNVDMITLDSAAMSLLGDAIHSTTMRTKVRRLYDIANVFSSLNLIEKTHHPDSRKPAFRWLGWKGNKVPTMSVDHKESKKRTFGTDITNISTKKSRVDLQIGWNSNQNKENFPVLNRCEDSKNHSDENKTKENTKSFHFGPFSPEVLSTTNESGNKTVSRIQDLENLASTYFPRYHNPVLDDLFNHYMEAWKSWYVEAAAKEKIQKGA